MKYCDLHIHSNASDGTFTPEEIAHRASVHGLSAIAITDHDTVANIHKGQEAALRYGVEYVPGTEFSTSDLDGRLHMLGYYFDLQDPKLPVFLDKIGNSRKMRVETICSKLTNLGITCTMADIEKIAGKASLGRPHIAEYLINVGIVYNIREAFERYLSFGKPAYVEKWAPTPEEIIDFIHSLNGLAVLAHAGVTTGAMEKIPELIDMGIDGIEAYYPRHKHKDQQKLIEYARANGLAITGGSDCHGVRRGDPLLGVFKVRYRLVEGLRRKWEEKYGKELNPNSFTPPLKT